MAYGTLQTDVINSSTGLFSTNNAYSGIAKAWVNFNGLSGSVAINKSFNVSSVTRTGTGQYTISFATAMADSTYAAIGTCNFYVDVGLPLNTTTFATGSIGVETYRPYPYNTAVDTSIVSVIVLD